MRGKVVDWIKKQKKLYIILQILRKPSGDLYKIIRAYFEKTGEAMSLWCEHLGDKYPDTTVYSISIGVGETNVNGFWGTMLPLLEFLDFADSQNFVPVVNWGKKMIYYDKDMDEITTNAFEYYFEPVSSISYQDVCSCKNVVNYHSSQLFFFRNYIRKSAHELYRIGDMEIVRWSSLYRRYIHLNHTTASYLDAKINKLLRGKRTIGVHVRGTDFKVGFKNHPLMIPSTCYVETVKEIMTEYKYEQVFLATDDTDVCKLFMQAFGDKLVYYTDTFRGDGAENPTMIDDARPLHHYNLGLEVLLDAYTLANCDSLVAGNSYVAFASRCINRVIEREYESITILDKGVFADDQKQASKFRKELSKIRKKEGNNID